MARHKKPQPAPAAVLPANAPSKPQEAPAPPTAPNGPQPQPQAPTQAPGPLPAQLYRRTRGSGPTCPRCQSDCVASGRVPTNHPFRRLNYWRCLNPACPTGRTEAFKA